jgi:hypothetical protein
VINDVGQKEKCREAESGEHTKAMAFYLFAADEEVSRREQYRTASVQAGVKSG